jgi:hypothetical protein
MSSNSHACLILLFGPEQLADLIYFGVTARFLLRVNQVAVNRCLTHKTTCTLSLRFEIGGSPFELGLEQLADFVYLGMATKLFL